MADGKPSTPVQPELDEVRQLRPGGGTAQTAPPAVKFDDEEEFTDGDDVHVHVQTRLARNSSMNQVRGKLEAHGSSSRVTDPNSSSVFEPNLHATSTAIGKQRSACENVLWYVQTYSLPLLLGVVVGMVMANFSEPLYEELKHLEIIPADTFTLFDHVINVHFLVNDIFMTFFFGIAAKEITEACLPGGSLNPPAKAANPLLATVGGVLGPVAVYFVMSYVLYENEAFGAPEHKDFCAQVMPKDAGGGHRRMLKGGTGGGAAGCGLGERWEDLLGSEACLEAVEGCRNSSLAEELVIADYSWPMVANGWGIPTATDISLAWVVATVIFGAGHPAISYLLLLAVADDGLGLIIIAIFYPSADHAFHGVWLLMILAGAISAYSLRRMRVMQWPVYIAVSGGMCWIGLLGAALHPALAFCFVVRLYNKNDDFPIQNDDFMLTK